MSTQIEALEQITLLCSKYPAVRSGLVDCGALPYVKKIQRLLLNRGASIDEHEVMRPYVERAMKSLSDNEVFELQWRISEATSDKERNEALRLMIHSLTGHERMRYGLIGRTYLDEIGNKTEEEMFVERLAIASTLSFYKHIAQNKTVLITLFEVLEYVRGNPLEQKSMIGLDSLFSEAIDILPPLLAGCPLIARNFVDTMTS